MSIFTFYSNKNACFMEVKSIANAAVKGTLGGAVGGALMGMGTGSAAINAYAGGAFLGRVAGETSAVLSGTVHAAASSVDGVVALGALSMLAATLEGREVLAVLAGGAVLGVAGGMLQRYQIVQWPEVHVAHSRRE